MSNDIRNHIDALIEKGAKFQLALKTAGQPIGPGKVEKISPESSLYRMLVPANMQANKHSQPKEVLLPMVFDASDVLIVIEEPINAAGESAIITCSNGSGGKGIFILGS